jgi:hypothetical protein
MQQLINFIHELLNHVEQILSQHLLFQQNENIPEFNLSQIDNPSMHDVRYYSMRHVKGPKLKFDHDASTHYVNTLHVF